MSNYTKGITAKKKILSTARRLFYEKGYTTVTIREIARDAQMNLGLITYYFPGKDEIGLTVYLDIRTGFSVCVREIFPDLDGVRYFLIESAIELLLSIRNPKFGMFFLQMSGETSFKEKVNTIIVSTLLKYTVDKNISQRALISSLSIMATKPALIEYALKNPGKIDLDTYLEYYLEAQIYQFNMDKSLAKTILDDLHKYYIDVGDNFTPVMVKKSD
ncbi:MAG: TetR/AcrR family transcriptional regulator [Treponema sp.]|nr:TetR/AcrR family transcriptional regulator [Treponema sp.]